jgi:hypothetical protein
VRWRRTGFGEEVLGGDDLLNRVYKEKLTQPNPDVQFVQCVQEQRPASPDFATAVRAHAIVDALYRSADAGGTPVDVVDPVSR